MSRPTIGHAGRFCVFWARLSLLLALTPQLVLASACSSLPEPATAPPGSGPAVAPSAGAPARLTLVVDGNPNGLYWDEEHDELLIADDGNNRILAWNDAHGFSVVELLPDAGGGGSGLGQLVMTPDGTLVVTRFGHGKTGGVIFVTPGSEPQLVPGLDPDRRRIGLAVGADGQLFDSWFVKVPDGRRGGIGALSLAGTETELPSQLTKPVGVLLRGDSLFVSDQDRGEVLRAPRAEPSDLTPFAHLERPDLLAAGPDGSLFTGGAGGKLYRINSDGTATVFAAGFGEVRGVAYDPARQRVFVIDHGNSDHAQGEAGTPHTLCILAAG